MKKNVLFATILCLLAADNAYPDSARHHPVIIRPGETRDERMWWKIEEANEKHKDYLNRKQEKIDKDIERINENDRESPY